ncbi:MAG TPA: M36 family metallopeptidase [Mycobacteriales bacterium]|nr:M36 family metallopeptidase [Mycobacteriales bacterium]
MRPARPSRPRTAATAALAVTALLAAPAVALGGPPRSADPVQVALDDIRNDPAKYGVTAADVDELEVTDAYGSPHNRVTHVYVRQQVGGTPVAGTLANVNVQDGEVVHFGSRLVAGVDDASGAAALDPAAAFEAAARGLGLAAPTDLRVLGESVDGAVRTALLTDGGVAVRPVPAALHYVATADAVRLAWTLEIEEPGGVHWWIVSVDAETGALLEQENLVVNERAGDHAHADEHADEHAGEHAGERAGAPFAAAAAVQPVADGSRYRVFAQPLESPNDGPRNLVTNPADPVFSPYGWHDLDGKPGPDTTTTRGNNTNTYADTVNDNAPDPGSQPTSANLRFEHVADERLTPASYRDAAVTNLFYWNNIMHDFTARFGFDEAAGNFQVVNYTGAGKGGDDVQAEAQDGGGVLNANFATPVDGRQPRMQMYLWVPGASAVLPNGQVTAPERPEALVRDGDFDSGVIAHEYGHGVSNRLTGGPNTGGCLNTSVNQEQMGEGWSDFFSYATTMRATDAADLGRTPRGIGTYVLYEDGRTAKGIRQTPYSTDMAIDYAVYDEIKSSSVAAPHGVGWVWASMLWEVYWNLVAAHGFNPDLTGSWETGGNNLAVQLVMDGMKFQPCRPGFEDGRDAILAADRALTGGENACAIWRGFAKRGLGVGASQGDSRSKTDGVQDFTLPEDC